jgi:CheY-like chemotaxis protein
VDVDGIQLLSKEEAERMWTPEVTALLVDDVEVNRTVAVSVMNQLEMKVDVATSGVSAIDMVMNNSYDIVFMDMTMPVMSGTDAMQEIRDLEGEDYKNLPIIAMTEDAVGEDRSSVIESGFDDVILKPLDIRNLATMLHAHIPQSKIKHKTNNMIQYIRESRYNQGLEELQNYIEVVRVLEKIGGSIEVYNKIITTFYNQNQNAVEELREKFGKDYRGFRNRIHNIRTGSVNIGAVELSREASKIEAAISIGNREYIRDNLGRFSDILDELLIQLAAYIEFVEAKQGMSDEEYAAKLAREKEEQQNKEEQEAEPLAIIDGDILMEMQESVAKHDLEQIRSLFNEICSCQYGAEDTDFITVLGESMEQEDYDTMAELLSTYLSLKYR